MKTLLFRLVASVIVISGLAVALYWPGLHGAFLFDDEVNILAAEGLRMVELSPQSIRRAISEGGAGPSGRPVAQLSFALNHYASGFAPFAFKATNLAIHLATGLLVFLLGLRLLKKPAYAALLAAFWLLHPIQLTAVLHVVQRMTSLSALFLFAAMLLHIQARSSGQRTQTASLLLAWCVFWPLSFFSKETGALFPCFALVWELIVRRAWHGRIDGFARRLAIALGIGLVAGIVYALMPAGQWLWAGYAFRPFTLIERLLTEGRILWFYLGLISVPRLDALGLHHDDIQTSTGLLSPPTTPLALLGMLGLLWVAWRLRRSQPLILFGIAWFFVGHLLESTVLPLELAHEHRNYLPLFGVLLAGMGMLSNAVNAGGERKLLGLALAAAMLLYGSFITGLRAHQFGDELRRTQIETQHHPESARAQYDAGRALAALPDAAFLDRPIHSFARTHFLKSSGLDPRSKNGLLGILLLDCHAGLPVDPSVVRALGRRLGKTAFAPGDNSTMYALKEMAIAGTLCLSRSDVEALFAAALENASVSAHQQARLLSWLGDYLTLGARDLGAAEAVLDKSLALAPYNASTRLKRAQLAFLRERHAEARKMLEELHDADLQRSEAETRALLLECLSPARSGQCSGK